MDFLGKELKLEHRLRTLRRLRILNARSIQRLEAVLIAAGNGRKPRLNHGDLRLKNVLVDGNGKIGSIIDWEHASSNLAPEWDLALALHDLSIDEAQTFLDGYGLRESALREAAPLIKALNLVNYAPVVEDIGKRNDAKLLDRYRTRLSGALDLYSL